jgi:hypothetical protein
MSDAHELSTVDAARQGDEAMPRLSMEELALEGGELLPDKEVLSILDLFVNIDLALDLAAPIDLAVAANANVAAPIDAAATANVLSFGSTAEGLAHQQTLIDQHISGQAVATAPQDATIDQSNDVIDGGTGGTAAGDTGGADAGGTTDPVTTADHTGGDTTGSGSSEVAQPVADQAPHTAAATTGDTGGTTTQVDTGSGALTDGPLLNVNVDAKLDADLAAPVAGAVAANANVAAPIDAAVSANIGTIDSHSVAIADQTAVVHQDLDNVTAQATAEQTADVTQ